jgi:hypothetical protein
MLLKNYVKIRTNLVRVLYTVSLWRKLSVYHVVVPLFDEYDSANYYGYNT